MARDIAKTPKKAAKAPAKAKAKAPAKKAAKAPAKKTRGDKSLSPKEARALAYLQTHKKGLTPDDARTKLGDARLSATILKLRRKGYKIDTLRVDCVNRWGENTWYGKYVYRDK